MAHPKAAYLGLYALQEPSSDRFQQLFARMLSQNEEDISLAEAALYIAGEEYPDLDVSRYLMMLDLLAKEAGWYIDEHDGPETVLHKLSEFLFVKQGFQGNQDDYYDPQNSYLNTVIDRKLGIPITLSIVYIEVSRRLGFVLEGIGLPGHFLLRHGPPEWELYVDPYDEGRLLNKADCEQIVEKLFHGRAQFREEHLSPCTKRQILIRMLSNLKGVYSNQGDYRKAMSAADRIQVIEPSMGSNLKDKATLHYQLKQYRLAIKELERYLKIVPEPEDAENIKQQIKGLWRTIATLN